MSADVFGTFLEGLREVKAEPMTEERLVEMEKFIGYWGTPHAQSLALRQLVDEVRRLQRENRLLHLSRGSAALVGMD
jgi:hypothetical protein